VRSAHSFYCRSGDSWQPFRTACWLAFLVVASLGLTLEGRLLGQQADEPPYKRVFTGEDAKRAAELQQQSNALPPPERPPAHLPTTRSFPQPCIGTR
jgi:hypothetical protein